MAGECFAAIHLCRIRATRLDATGNVEAGPNNLVVTDKPIQLGITPVLEQGQDKTLTGGCDCIVATYRGYDKLKRFDLELDLGALDPALIELLTGGEAILDGDVPIGVQFSSQQFECSGPPTPNVAIEAWQDAWDVDHQADAFPYVRWIFPSSFWQFGAQTLQNDFLQPKLTGFTRGNDVWGEGPYGDQPESINSLGGFFYDDTLPEATCGYQTAALT